MASLGQILGQALTVLGRGGQHLYNQQTLGPDYLERRFRAEREERQQALQVELEQARFEATQTARAREFTAQQEGVAAARAQEERGLLIREAQEKRAELMAAFQRREAGAQATAAERGLLTPEQIGEDRATRRRLDEAQIASRRAQAAAYGRRGVDDGGPDLPKVSTAQVATRAAELRRMEGLSPADAYAQAYRELYALAVQMQSPPPPPPPPPPAVGGSSAAPPGPPAAPRPTPSPLASVMQGGRIGTCDAADEGQTGVFETTLPNGSTRTVTGVCRGGSVYEQGPATEDPPLE